MKKDGYYTDHSCVRADMWKLFNWKKYDWYKSLDVWKIFRN